MEASIVIPTYKRPDKLENCLKNLVNQVQENDSEIIIIDDSKRGEGEKIAKKYETECTIKYRKNPKKGRATARNEGIRHARGKIIIFIGDDIVVEDGWLSEHISLHEKYPDENISFVGFITWPPDLKVSKYMHWLENGGPLLRFKGLKNEKETNIWHFYTGNISIKKTLLWKEQFLEDIETYGWEDIELGFRLQEKHGMRLYYAEKAIAYHDHPYEEKNIEKYGEEVGFSAGLFQSKKPNFPVTPGSTKRAIFSIISSLSPALKKCKKEWYWYSLFKKNYLKGIRKAEKQRS
jgi:glycosyltransferase involved in cell wall biosynthesis